MDDRSYARCLKSCGDASPGSKGADGRRKTTVSSGSAAIDNLLPKRVRRGTLSSGLSRARNGACTLHCWPPRSMPQRGMLVVFDGRRDFCPPAAVRLEIDPERLMSCMPRVRRGNWRWIGVASPAGGGVLAWPEGRSDRTFRRWNLAVEEGRLGLLLRSETSRADPPGPTCGY